MQEHRPGGDNLTDSVTMKQFKKALEDTRNTAVTLHKPGSVVKMNSATYVVDEDGAFRKVQ